MDCKPLPTQWGGVWGGENWHHWLVAGDTMKNFVFLGDEIALDLTNTDIITRSKRRDLLVTPGDLASWWSAALRHHPEISTPAIAFDGAALQAVKDLRDTLRRIFVAVIDGDRPAEDDLTAVNKVLANTSPALGLNSAGHVASNYVMRGGDLGHVLLTVALSALRQLSEYNPERLRKCDNERCTLLFYDNSRSATRRWCSTACMNRMRSAERYRVYRQSLKA